MTNTVLPTWSDEIRTLYLSGAANQFILSGNVNDRLFWRASETAEARLGSLVEFLREQQLSKFDVILAYDLGAGLHVNREGEEIFSQWPSARERRGMPATPQDAIRYIDHYLRYCCNLSRTTGEGEGGKKKNAGLKQAEVLRNVSVAVIIRGAHLVMPAIQVGLNYQLNSMASVVRSWSSETHFLDHNISSFLIAENLNDVHPMLVNNPRVGLIRIPLPPVPQLVPALEHLSGQFARALESFSGAMDKPAGQLAGATLSSIESLVKRKEYEGESLGHEDLAALKKGLVEKDCQGLIEFIESDRTLENAQGHEPVKEWIRQDIALWKDNDLRAMPMGYLLCGPVGTGKTYLVECLAGEAAVPVVKFKNFRDKWVGSTEGNLETIFRLLQALGRCVVFIDEADQALGSRSAGSGDSGVSGRVYSMMAKEMSDTSNRGRILWILASSRPDLIEVDLKRPGRVDVKIPLFPSTSPEEGYGLIRALCGKHAIWLSEEPESDVLAKIPEWVTPGAAESLAIKVYRQSRTKGLNPEEALRDCLAEYQNPVPRDIMEFQIGLAAGEASDLSFVPDIFREFGKKGAQK